MNAKYIEILGPILSTARLNRIIVTAIGQRDAPKIRPTSCPERENSSCQSPRTITRKAKPTPAANSDRKLAQNIRRLSESEI